MSFSVFSVDGISGNKGFMLSKLAGCWLAVTWVQNIAEFSDKRRLVCETRFIASRSSHTPHHHYTIYTIYTIYTTYTIYTIIYTIYTPVSAPACRCLGWCRGARSWGRRCGRCCWWWRWPPSARCSHSRACGVDILCRYVDKVYRFTVLLSAKQTWKS